MKRTGLVFLIVIAAKIADAQSASTLMGARTIALGSSSASLSDEWSGMNNPAGLGWLKGAWMAVTSERRPSLKGADRMAATVGAAGKAGAISAHAFSFGDAIYSEQTLAIAYGHTLGLASLGSRVDLIQYRAEGVEPVLAVGVTVGTRAQITDEISVGGYATNINRPHFPDGRALPVRVAAGFTWQPSVQVLFCSELEKVGDLEPVIKSGIELSPIKKVKFRGGFNLFPYAFFGGFGVRAWKINFDYALSFTYALSYSHQVSIQISRVKERK